MPNRLAASRRLILRLGQDHWGRCKTESQRLRQRQCVLHIQDDRLQSRSHSKTPGDRSVKVKAISTESIQSKRVRREKRQKHIGTIAEKTKTNEICAFFSSLLDFRLILLPLGWFATAGGRKRHSTNVRSSIMRLLVDPPSTPGILRSSRCSAETTGLRKNKSPTFF